MTEQNDQPADGATPRPDAPPRPDAQPGTMGGDLDQIPGDTGTIGVWTGAPSDSALNMLRQHVDAMKVAYEFVTPMVRTTMVPDRYRNKPDEATAAVLYGNELGLNPIQSMQRIIVIHGMPTLEARTMVALLMRRGYLFQTVETTDDVVTVEGWGLRGQYERSSWTIERAHRAGYVPTPINDASLKRPGVATDWVHKSGQRGASVIGNMKYITDPQAMLYAKAAAEVARKLAPDALLGMPYTAEEAESFDVPDDDDVPVSPTRRAPRRGGAGAATLKARAEAAKAAAQADDEPHDAEEVPLPEPGPVLTDEPVAPGNQPYVDAAAGAADAFPDPPAPVTDQAADDAEAARQAAAPAEPGPSSPKVDPGRARLNRQFHALLKDGGLEKDNRDERLIFSAYLVDRPISTSNDMTLDELENAIRTMADLKNLGNLSKTVEAVLDQAKTDAATSGVETTEGNEGNG